ncbi:MAG TPA: hypothetical protein VFM54_24455 [Micromonosporaceae bacterium]|nr:hypothetical protein [Micromonosporaceae bacterium]
MAREARPSLPPHAFEPDSEVPADYKGRHTCRRCKHTGVDGDHQHPTGALPLEPAYPEQSAEVTEWESRRLGEVA